MHADFLAAIQSKKKIGIRFNSQKDDDQTSRICAPMDFGPHARVPDKGNRYHVWNYRGTSGAHPMPIDPAEIISLDILEEDFDPAEFVKWQPKWHIKRDWGIYS